mgnify:CR=1 FL=1
MIVMARNSGGGSRSGGSRGRGGNIANLRRGRRRRSTGGRARRSNMATGTFGYSPRGR